MNIVCRKLTIFRPVENLLGFFINYFQIFVLWNMLDSQWFQQLFSCISCCILMQTAYFCLKHIHSTAYKTANILTINCCSKLFAHYYFSALKSLKYLLISKVFFSRFCHVEKQHAVIFMYNIEIINNFSYKTYFRFLFFEIKVSLSQQNAGKMCMQNNRL